MKILLGLFLFVSIIGYSQVSIGKLEPNDSAQLEIVSNNKGLLIPKISLISLTDVTTITNGNIDGLTVFNTSTTSDLKPGYYYWYGNVWNRLITKEDIIGGSGITNATLSQDGTDLILTDSEGGIVKIPLADINTTNSSLAKSTDGLSLELTDSNNNKVSIALSDISSPEFKKVGTVISNTTDIATDDFVFGSTQLDDDTGSIDDDSRMFFDKSKAAFRVGGVTENHWNDEKYNHDNDGATPKIDLIGEYSVAMGYNTVASGFASTSIGSGTLAAGTNSISMGAVTKASGVNSIAMGFRSIASGSPSTSIGYNTKAEGNYSTALGNYTTASGENSTAMGDNTKSEGYGSVSMGVYTTASGENSTTMGFYTTAKSYSETVIGAYNKDYTLATNGTTVWNDADRLFTIGNGNATTKNDALVMLKSGNTTLNGALTLGSSTAGDSGLILNDNDSSNTVTIKSPTDITTDYILTLPANDGVIGQVLEKSITGELEWANKAIGLVIPAGDGTPGQVLETDGNGVLSWTNPATGGGAGEFTRTGQVVHNTANIATDDFVFGSTQLDGIDNSIFDSGDIRMFFDKSKGALRVGAAIGDQWDDANVGNFSLGLGINTISNGYASIAIGQDATATGDSHSIAIGHQASSKGRNSVAIGASATSNKFSSIALGELSTTMEWASIAMGYHTHTAGVASTAVGHEAITMGNYSTSLGYRTNSAGHYSTAIGQGVTTTAYASTALGYLLKAETAFQVTLGVNNKEISGDVDNFVPTDPLLVIGNGIDHNSRSNALVMLKNGNTTIYGNLTINNGTTDTFNIDKATGDTTISGNVTINDVLKLTPKATAPTSPSEGTIYYDSVSKKIRVWTGAVWSDLN
ncbi:MAG: hypothetical protein HRT66_13490 [Flavobacteriaceae bacterium]|nr:hypothetical protein [Flavobacteriaceae bacterium]